MTKKLDLKQCLLIAHRGFSAKAPENTLPAYHLAAEAGYYGIETDIQTSKDKMFLTFHDDNLLRMTGVNRLIRSSIYADMKDVPITSGSQVENYPKLTIPTLEEYLELCIHYDCVPVIEIKQVIDWKDLDAIIQIINDYDLYDKAIIISFNLFYLLYLRERYTIKIQYLLSTIDREPMVLDICEYYNFDLDINYRSVTRELIERCHERNIKVNAWTVDDADLAQQLIDWGIDYITTNKLQ